VDTAVRLVEEGRLQQAVEVLQQGISLLGASFPHRCALAWCDGVCVLMLQRARTGACVCVCVCMQRHDCDSTITASTRCVHLLPLMRMHLTHSTHRIPRTHHRWPRRVMARV
jgi:hypothetical protein